MSPLGLLYLHLYNSVLLCARITCKMFDESERDHLKVLDCVISVLPLVPQSSASRHSTTPSDTQRGSCHGDALVRWPGRSSITESSRACII